MSKTVLNRELIDLHDGPSVAYATGCTWGNDCPVCAARVGFRGLGLHDYYAGYSSYGGWCEGCSVVPDDVPGMDVGA